MIMIHLANITTIYVLSGDGKIDDIEKHNIKPDYIYENIKELNKDIGGFKYDPHYRGDSH